MNGLERPLTYLALGQLGALFIGVLFSGMSVRAWHRSGYFSPEDFPPIVRLAEAFARYGLWLALLTVAWLVLSILLAQNRIPNSIGDRDLVFSGFALAALFAFAGFVLGMLSFGIL